MTFELKDGLEDEYKYYQDIVMKFNIEGQFHFWTYKSSENLHLCRLGAELQGQEDKTLLTKMLSQFNLQNNRLS